MSSKRVGWKMERASMNARDSKYSMTDHYVDGNQNVRYSNRRASKDVSDRSNRREFHRDETQDND